MNEETATQDPEGTAGPSESEPMVDVGSEIVDDTLELAPSTAADSGDVPPPDDAPPQCPPADPNPTMVDARAPEVDRPKVWNVGAQKWVDAETGE